METTPISAVDSSARTAKSRLQDVQSYTVRVLSALGPKHLDGNGMRGRVLVAFSLSADGTLQGARIAQSSGEHSLDVRALQIVGRAVFPAPPGGLGVAHRSYVSAFTFD